MITSKLNARGQTTIPLPVREILKLQPGDDLIYEIVDGRVTLTKARPETRVDDPFRTFEEWHSEADSKTFAGL